jgi:hypothetical protein
MNGTVISVPINNESTQLLLNDSNAPPYVIRLVDGSVHRVSPEILESIVKDTLTIPKKNYFPSWLGNGQKVMYLDEGIYKKGIMEWDTNTLSWRFSQHRHNGIDIFGVSLPNFSQSFQQYIDDGTLVPGWHKGANFSLAGSAQHVSAASLQCHLPPGSLTKALCSKNIDRLIWLASYKEEYDGLLSNDTFEIIGEEEYKLLQSRHGRRLFHLCASLQLNIQMVFPLVPKAALSPLGILITAPGPNLTVSPPLCQFPWFAS